MTNERCCDTKFPHEHCPMCQHVLPGKIFFVPADTGQLADLLRSTLEIHCPVCDAEFDVLLSEIYVGEGDPPS